MGRYVYVTTDVDVRVDLGDINASDLREELDRRNGIASGTSPDDLLSPVTMHVERADLERMRLAIFRGQYEQACREFGDLIRNALGTAI